MSSKFFAFLSRMKFINRWSLMRNTTLENTAEHSLYVSMIAHCLAVVHNRLTGAALDPCRVGMIGAYHDTGEVITGDIPTPIKYFSSEMRDAYKKIEKTAGVKIFDTLPPELQEAFDPLLHPDKEEAKIVKYADKLTAYIKCIEESGQGNNEFARAYKTIERELKDYRSPAVDYFMDTFIAAYRLTLDELSE
ncbi:MAG: 5'-deoxynucleotidase [Clostridiales bacterium]|jgi:5'-deoxynucleotidase|nr:5'-deoxynucleotidase [Clostridiales bacterium]